MSRKRKRKRGLGRWNLPPFFVPQILEWADLYHKCSCRWPRWTSGRIPGTLGETWSKVDRALRFGFRGLPGGSSLAQLLEEQREVRNSANLPCFSVKQILAWVDAHHRRTGNWPTTTSGLIVDAPGVTWLAVHKALCNGGRGLPGGSSLARFMGEHRGKRQIHRLSPLTDADILSWVDAYYQRTGRWPTSDSGPIAEAAGTTWCGVNQALLKGQRGLPGGSSLPRLLAEHREVRNLKNLPPLTLEAILAWADAHQRQTGKWPTVESGSILEAPSETWSGVNASLVNGRRGLSGGTSLARLLAQSRGKRNIKDLPRLTTRQIRAWAVAWHQRTGRWPTQKSGLIPESSGETWSAVDNALMAGLRGLPGGSSLSRLLGKREREVYRGKNGRFLRHSR
jgi:hypothetical protein